MKCTECNKEYDENVVVPSPIPDSVCYECGNTLTAEEIQALTPPSENA
jgi:DNA-directed RNA polymerase subunit RPC12/RpoP